MKIEVSIGEIIDKISILDIKLRNIIDENKLINVRNEYDYLTKILNENGTFNLSSDEYKELYKINLYLWEVEDSIRIKEKEKNFDSEFISLARKVYITNDKRAELKKELNIKYGSNFIEEKSYQKY